MQDVENDMDDLFREAASNYKLKAVGDWDKIGAILPVNTVVQPGVTAGWKRLLILLLIIGLLIYNSIIFYKIVKQKGSAEQPTETKQIENTAPLNAGKKIIIKPKGESDAGINNLPLSPKDHLKKTPDNKIEVPHSTKESLGKPYRSSITATPQKIKSSIQNPTASKEKQTTNIPVATKPIGNSNNRNSENRNQSNTSPINTPVNNEQDKKRKNQSLIAIKPKEQEEPTDSLHSTSESSVDSAIVIIPADTIAINNSVPKQRNNDAESLSSDSAKILKPAVTRFKGFYIGIVGGPEWNQVKNQGATKTGFDVGGIFGFRFNNKLSLETGLNYARKYYSSNGLYFNLQMTDKKVLYLDGRSAVIEVPVKIKFDFLQGKKTNWFAGAGLNSFIMTNEENDYLLLVNGAEMSMTTTYKDASRYFAAAIDVSAGYERVLKNGAAIRLEPYIQVPLKGMGVGTMRIMSMGLHLSFIKGIWVNKKIK